MARHWLFDEVNHETSPLSNDLPQAALAASPGVLMLNRLVLLLELLKELLNATSLCLDPGK